MMIWKNFSGAECFLSKSLETFALFTVKMIFTMRDCFAEENLEGHV